MRSDVPTIGNQIKELRERAGLTQVQLANRTGLRQPVISRLEAGSHVPTWRTLERIAHALGASVLVRLVPEDSLIGSAK